MNGARLGPPIWRRIAQVQIWSRSQSDTSLAQRMAGTAFLIRVASAACVYLSQVVFARWMGSSEFGIYVYVWTWVLLLGDIVNLGLAPAAQRFIPLYTQRKAFDLLRGFIAGSKWLVLGYATVCAAIGAIIIRALGPAIPQSEVIPLYLACLTLPAYALSLMLDGIARSYNWIGLALLPGYILRPLLVILFMAVAHVLGSPADATTAMAAAVAATWLSIAVQWIPLGLRLRRSVAAGAKAHDVRTWMATALPILMVWGFYTLLTYTDIVLLQQFRTPDEVALYYAASKTLALVAFVYFSVAAAVAHRFAEYHAAGDHARLADMVTASIRWTFWPSLAAMVVVLALGKPFLWLFGPAFVDAYPVMFVLAAGLLARASVGPAERLLSVLGEQRRCAAVYATAFAINVLLCILLIPRWGIMGAATATAAALISESCLLFAIARWKLNIHTFVWQKRRPVKPTAVARV